MIIATHKIRSSFYEEPSLKFCGGRDHVSPKIGISLFGPRSLDLSRRHPTSVNVGIIGSGQSIGSAQSWISSCIPGVPGDESNTDFPGFQDDRGFYCTVLLDDNWIETVTRNEIAKISEIRLYRDRFTASVELVSDKIRLLSQKDNPPDYIILALPDDLLSHCEVVTYTDPELGGVHRNFRRAIKAEAMKYHIPTQILLQRTTEALPGAKNVDHKSRCAWNFFTGLYFKAGGIPWSPSELAPGTCYVGISFYRPLGAKANSIRTSVAQAFDEHGDGLVLRGQDFQWDAGTFGESPHLTADIARNLIDMVLKRYSDEMKQSPRRIVVHKSSRFWPEERFGFEKALSSVQQYDLVSVSPTDEIRLLRSGKYPPLRGTRFSVGDMHYLYTTGFVSALNRYPHGHIPSPIQITDHIGDSSVDTLLQEILVLTKMNWNTAQFAGLMPITLKFSRLVGDIMREIPNDREPLPQFKYYM